jgi:hypothetical protein
MKRIGAFVTVLAIIVLAFSSCSNQLVRSAGAGSLKLVAGRSAKTITPSSGFIASYRASGSGPSGATTDSKASSTGSFSFTELSAGLWTFTIEGLSSGGTTIATGSTTVTIVAGSSASASVTLVPTGTGTGTLSLSASWSSSKPISAITGTMTPSGGGSSTSISFTVSGTSGSYSGSFAAGNYILALSASNSSGKVIASAQVEAVQIYQGLTSGWSGSIDDSRFVSSSKDITAFSFDAQSVTATISGTTITAIVPFTVDYSKLVASFTTTGATVSVGGMTQTSGTTANDFTAGTLSYLVTAADGTTQTYTVNVAGFTNQAVSGQVLAASSDFTHIILGDVGIRNGYGAYSGSITTSADGGTTWTQNSTAAAMANGMGLRILGVTSSSDFTKLMFSVNQWTSWQAQNTGLYASSDSGSTWTYLGSGAFQNGSTSEFLALSPDGATLLGGKNAKGVIWGTSSYIGLSTDGGTTWTNQNSSGDYAWN